MIRGTKTKINDSLNLDLNVGIHNRFDIEVIDVTTGKIKQKAQAFNIICNTYWSSVISGNSNFNQNIAYGSGSGTPSESDTTLFNQIASTKSTFVSATTDYTTGIFARKRYIVLGTTTAVGKTITEVGIASGNTIYTHAMLEDMNGNPISIVKTDTDVINIYSTIFVHFNETGYSNGSVVLQVSSKPYDIFDYLGGQAYNYENQDSWGASVNLAWQVGVSNCNTAHGSFTWVSGSSRVNDLTNKTITIKFPRIEAGTGNFTGGIKMIGLGAGGRSGIDVDYGPYLYCALIAGGDWWPYTQITNEAVGTGDGETTDFALKFDDAHDITVLVNGVQDPNVSLTYGPASTSNPQRHMLMLHPSSTLNHLILNPTSSTEANYQGTKLFYNPYWEIGIKSMSLSGITCTCSDDLQTWYSVTSSSIPAEHRHKKYWKGYCPTSTSASGSRYFPAYMTLGDDTAYSGKVLHFDTAPASGAVITASYKTDTIAKDSDHVLDISVKMTFSGYTED